jgi:hypothetical protein
MHLDRYVAVADATHKMYEFLSEGPQGAIRKVVQYLLLYDSTYSLGFGDWNEERQRVEDSVRSNNMDRDKVLVTVAVTVLDFLKHHPGTTVLLEGSSQARTRLYQMQIKSAWYWISQLLYVEGKWEFLRLDGNYGAFAVKNKLLEIEI